MLRKRSINALLDMFSKKNGPNIPAKHNAHETMTFLRLICFLTFIAPNAVIVFINRAIEVKMNLVAENKFSPNWYSLFLVQGSN